MSEWWTQVEREKILFYVVFLGFNAKKNTSKLRTNEIAETVDRAWLFASVKHDEQRFRQHNENELLGRHEIIDSHWI